METVQPEENKTQGKPPLPGEYTSSVQKQPLFGGQLLGCRKHPSTGKVVINPLFVDDTDASNDELIRDKQEARSTSQLHPPQSTSHRDKDHYVTVFTISNGEVTFQRSGSQQWFSEASADESAKTQAQTVHVTHAHRPRASSTSPDRKRYPSVTSCSHDRKYIALPAPGSQSDGPIRKYDREAILRRHLRGGRRTDYGFIDGAVVLADYDGASLCSGDAVPAGSALTDDQKVAARICNGSLQGTTSPEIILVHPNQQDSPQNDVDNCDSKAPRSKSLRTKGIRQDVREYRKVKACRLLGLTISMLIVIGLAVALVIYFAKKEMAF